MRSILHVVVNGSLNIGTIILERIVGNMGNMSDLYMNHACYSICGTTERSNHEQQSTSMMVSCCITGRLIYTEWQIGPIVSFRCVTEYTSTTRKLRFARCRLSYWKYEECLIYKCWTKTNEMLRIAVSTVRAPTCCIM